jgi:hypothetical protein
MNGYMPMVRVRDPGLQHVWSQIGKWMSEWVVQGRRAPVIRISKVKIGVMTCSTGQGIKQQIVG